jgi:hypothetical protein
MNIYQACSAISAYNLVVQESSRSDQVAHTTMSAGPQEISMAEAEVAETLSSSPALTMESLVSVLTELTNARETEGRVQLYRMQEQYESKLEAIQVGHLQWTGDRNLILYLLCRSCL